MAHRRRPHRPGAALIAERVVAISPAIREAFAARFPERPELRLPAGAPAGAPQQLAGGGWWVSYRADVEDGAAVLTYFAHHRMSDDALHRIDSGGRVETLGAVQLFYFADDPAAEDAYHEHNRRFYEDVDRLGLGGGAPPAAVINAYLRSQRRPK